MRSRLMGKECWFPKIKRVVEIDCTTMRICLSLLGCILKNGKDGIFYVMSIFYHIFFNKEEQNTDNWVPPSEL